MFSRNTETKKMNTLNKNSSSSIALILMLAVSGVMAIVPAANAHSPAWNVPTHAFLNVAPNPIGVGQQVTIIPWINDVPPTANGQYGDRWQGYMIKVTKPDGTTESLGPFTSDDEGGHPVGYVPTQVGNYSFVFSFPGQTIAGANPSPGAPGSLGTGIYNSQTVGDYYQPSTSAPVSLAVQQQQIQSYPDNPLPTSYWQRPVESVNTAWSSIDGAWLGFAANLFAATGMYGYQGNFAPYTTGPKTAHILWTQPVAFGGQATGEFGGTESSNYYTGMQYEPKFSPIIISGVVYYTLYPGSSTSPEGWVAESLKTGKILWTKDTTLALKCGQVLDYNSINQYGALAYLWATSGSTYEMFDAFTGNWILNITGVTGTTLEGPNGELMNYYVNNTASGSTLNVWNSTTAIQNPQAFPWWRPGQGQSLNFTANGAVQLTAPIATNMTGTTGLNFTLSISAIDQDNGILVMAASTGTLLTQGQTGYRIEAGYSMTTGQLLWGPINRTETPYTTIIAGPAGNGVYTVFTKDTMSWMGYSTLTGQQLWSNSVLHK
jgi:hypothetical protein